MATVDMALVQDTLDNQVAEGRERLARDGGGTGEIRVIHSADMQFIGQSHLLSVPILDPTLSRDALQAAFEAVYWARFEVSLPEIKANLVNLNTAVIGMRQQVDLRLLLDPASSESLAESRPVWFEESGWTDTPILQRATLAPGMQLSGPAIVEQMDTTTVLAPGMQAQVDEIGNMIVHVGTGGPNP
jgi:N-methylhydantoinase A